MSLNRIALRMAAMAAITNFGRAPHPTLAGKQIFDSKIEPTETFEGRDPVPLAVIYTDYDKDFWPFGKKAETKRTLTITIELLVVQTDDVVDKDGNVLGYEIKAPTTDSELEFSLDMFEMQVFDAFKADNPAADCFRHLIVGYENIISRRGASVVGEQRLSARQITIETETLRDVAPGHIDPIVDTFLSAIADRYQVYASRAALLRAQYLATRGVNPETVAPYLFGSTKSASEQLGYPQGPIVRLPPSVRWLDPLGRPL